MIVKSKYNLIVSLGVKLNSSRRIDFRDALLFSIREARLRKRGLSEASTIIKKSFLWWGTRILFEVIRLRFYLKNFYTIAGATLQHFSLHFETTVNLKFGMQMIQYIRHF